MISQDGRFIFLIICNPLQKQLSVGHKYIVSAIKRTNFDAKSFQGNFFVVHYPSQHTVLESSCPMNNCSSQPSNTCYHPPRFVKTRNPETYQGYIAQFDHSNLFCPPPIAATNEMQGYALRKIEEQTFLNNVEGQRLPHFHTETRIENDRNRRDQCREGSEAKVFHMRNDCPIKYPLFTPGAKIAYDVGFNRQRSLVKAEQLLPPKDLQDGKCIIDVLPSVNKDLRQLNLIRWASTDPYTGMPV